MSKKLKKQFRKQLIRHWLDHAAIFNAKADETINRLISEPVRPRPWPDALKSVADDMEAYKALAETLPPAPAEINLHFPGGPAPIFAETNLWFDHEPMLYVVKAEHLDRPYLFAKEEEADAFYALMRDRLPNSTVTVTTAWLFADYDTAFTSFEADIA